MELVELAVLDLFKVMVVQPRQKNGVEINASMSTNGVVLDFIPTAHQERVIKSVYKPLPIRTLFSVEEVQESTPGELIAKQVFHYIEVYGLDEPGLFNLEVKKGEILPMVFIRGVTVDELGEMVRELLYRNAPVKDAESIMTIINAYEIEYDINQVANNELRVLMFDPAKDIFQSGDDAVRWIVKQTTDQSLLIKSREVIMNVGMNSFKITEDFLIGHEVPLARVFNRHKKLIVGLKSNPKLKRVVNRIARRSKTAHVPIRESINKVFLARARDPEFDTSVLEKISVRDKFKYLNVLAFKRMQLDVDAFIIRNGKIHIEPNRSVWKLRELDAVENEVLQSLEKDLAHLKGKNILLDPMVDYGLPISRKQTVGQLPFGTQITIAGEKISSGIYWENSWGARDLDLSTVDPEGNRTGWGQYSAYSRSNPVTFSGDVVDAREGAMEFMTSNKHDYGLFVNIFSGEIGCEAEIVIGTGGKNRWIKDVAVREKTTLDSRGMIVGFVKDKTFTVWKGRLNNSRISGGQKALVQKGMAANWTAQTLFTYLGVDYNTKSEKDVKYDYDLSYNGFSYDKLEGLLLN
jgi:hypothetical protein